MKFSFHSPLALLLVAGGAFACGDSPTTTRLSPDDAPTPLFARIRATDSMMVVTEVTYSDTSLVLKRLTALPVDLSVSATIGSEGGEIKINDAGGKIVVPRGALTAPTLITMTAIAGPNVAYEFQPHGLVFAAPVKIQQTIAGTYAEKYPTLLQGMHGSYYDQSSLEGAFLDTGKAIAKVSENQIGYIEANASQIKFYVGHFSGYLVSCGRE